MAYCMNCGTELDEDAKCPKCEAEKAEAESSTKKTTSERVNEATNYVASEFKNAEDKTEDFDKEDIENNIIFAILAYFGLLVLVPIIAAPDSKFAKFHAGQGLNLLILEIVYGVVASVLMSIFSHFGFILSVLMSGVCGICSIAILILWIQGIANAANHKARKLPFIGKFEILK